MNAKRMQGVYVVEFALIGSLMFILIFGALEMGRLYFTVNALNESVRRGARLAAVCGVSDKAVLLRAMFNTEKGPDASRLIGNLNISHLVLTYLNKDGGVEVTYPSDGVAVFSTIRYVQLQVKNFRFDFFIPELGMSIELPVFRATLPRESLGYDGESEVPTSC